MKPIHQQIINRLDGERFNRKDSDANLWLAFGLLGFVYLIDLMVRIFDALGYNQPLN